ncbi:MAG TPA: VOC family protein [Candidatus Saccharimonadales bacterium]|nr:VOC family protein [Candidatus Saccharimonadales bacterium]
MSGRFDHMDLYVGDLARAVGFWGPFLEQLGFRKGTDRPTAKSWRGAGAEIFFVQAEADFVAQGYHRKRIGLNHLAFSVDSRDELAALLDWVKERGQRLLYAGAIEETATQHRFFFEDPERIKVEVVAAR